MSQRLSILKFSWVAAAWLFLYFSPSTTFAACDFPVVHVTMFPEGQIAVGPLVVQCSEAPSTITLNAFSQSPGLAVVYLSGPAGATILGSNNVAIQAGEAILSVCCGFTLDSSVTFTTDGEYKLQAVGNVPSFAVTVVVRVGCQVKPEDISRFAGGPYSLDRKPTSIYATFIPTDADGFPKGLDSAKAACGVTRFNWQQRVDAYPSPSPIFPANPSLANWPPGLAFTAPDPRGSFPDPPNGGYTCAVSLVRAGLCPPSFDVNRYPFYYPDDPNDLALRSKFIPVPCQGLGCTPDSRPVETSDTLSFWDAPADPCLPGGNPQLQMIWCNGASAQQFRDLAFTTQLVGIRSDGTVIENLYSWTWKSTFNGVSCLLSPLGPGGSLDCSGTGTGGIVAISNDMPVDPTSGTGGITITSINGVPQTPASVSCTATPNTLWPPNGKSVPVTISGTVTAGTQTIPVGGTTFSVTDKYGQDQPTGSIAVAADGSYSFTVPLIAARNGTDRDGRTYTINVIAVDAIGNTGSCAAVVTVPHDQGH